MERRARNLWIHVNYICGMIFQSALCVYLICTYCCGDDGMIGPERGEEVVVKTSWRPTLKHEERTIERAIELLDKSPSWHSIHNHEDFVQDDTGHEGDIFSYHSYDKMIFVEHMAELSCFENYTIFEFVQSVDFLKNRDAINFFYVLFRYIFDIPELIPFEQPTYGDIYLTIRVGDKKPGLWPWQRMDGGLRLVGSPGKSPPTGYDPVFSFVDFRARYPRRRFDYCTKTPGGKAE